jgi:hypothetical protein
MRSIDLMTLPCMKKIDITIAKKNFPFYRMVASSARAQALRPMERRDETAIHDVQAAPNDSAAEPQGGHRSCTDIGDDGCRGDGSAVSDKAGQDHLAVQCGLAGRCGGPVDRSTIDWPSRPERHRRKSPGCRYDDRHQSGSVGRARWLHVFAGECDTCVRFGALSESRL